MEVSMIKRVLALGLDPLLGAGLRAAPQLLLFEKLLNLVHTRAPGAKLCFNNTPADTAEAVQRWV
jgi:hypothetical protein